MVPLVTIAPKKADNFTAVKVLSLAKIPYLLVKSFDLNKRLSMDNRGKDKALRNDVQNISQNGLSNSKY